MDRMPARTAGVFNTPRGEAGKVSKDITQLAIQMDS